MARSTRTCNLNICVDVNENVPTLNCKIIVYFFTVSQQIVTRMQWFVFNCNNKQQCNKFQSKGPPHIPPWIIRLTESSYVLDFNITVIANLLTEITCVIYTAFKFAATKCDSYFRRSAASEASEVFLPSTQIA